MTTRRAGLAAASLMIGCAAALPAAAQDTHVKIYGGPAYVAPLSDSNVTFGTVTDAVKAEQHVGWNFGIEGRPTKLIGIEIDYVRANQDVQFGGQTIGDTDFSPLTATLNFHIVPTKYVDLYLGPSYSYVDWGDIRLNQTGQGLISTNGLGTESDSAWGAALGLDIGLGKHVAITGGIRYIDTNLGVEGGPKLSVDPLVGRLGVAVRF